MERGEYERAYRYLTRASNDAQQYGSRLRSMQVARLAPVISKAYDAERERAQHRTNILLFVMSAALLLLLCFLLFIVWLLKKRRMANEKIRLMNEELCPQCSDEGGQPH